MTHGYYNDKYPVLFMAFLRAIPPILHSFWQVSSGGQPPINPCSVSEKLQAILAYKLTQQNILQNFREKNVSYPWKLLVTIKCYACPLIPFLVCQYSLEIRLQFLIEIITFSSNINYYMLNFTYTIKHLFDVDECMVRLL